MEFDKYVKDRDNTFEYFKNNKNNLYIIFAPQYKHNDLNLSKYDRRYLKSNIFWMIYDSKNDNQAYQIFSSGKIHTNKLDYSIVLKNSNNTSYQLVRTQNTITIKGKFGINTFTKTNQLDINGIHFNNYPIKRRIIFCAELHSKLNLSFISNPSYILVVANHPETHFIPEISIYIINTKK